MTYEETKAQIKTHANKDEYEEAILLAEQLLYTVSTTDFHKVIGRDLLSLTGGAAGFITDFYNEALKQIDVKAMYFEMNGFGINPDLWFFNAYGLNFCGNPDDPEDESWLADYQYYYKYACVISGYEDIQAATKDHLDNKRYKDPVQRDAKDYSETVVSLRYLQLMKNVARFAVENDMPWKSIPFFANSHDDGMLYKSIK
jgi:hypothetical protein